VRLKGLGKWGGGDSNDLIENRTRDVPAVPQPTTLPRALSLQGRIISPSVITATYCKAVRNCVHSVHRSSSSLARGTEMY
jgi:hypothetical protein